MSFDITFSLGEWLALTGLAQSLLLLVYIIFRVRNWRQAALALSYFSVLALAFGTQFALRLEDYEDFLRCLLWFCWSMSPPLCYLLVLQVAKGVDLPPVRQFWAFATVPAVFIIISIVHPDDKLTGLYWLGSLSGAAVMLALWAHKNLFAALRKSKGGHERYWLIIMLVAANVGAVAINFMRSSGNLTVEEADSSLVALGIAFVYLASTTLFRVYPLPLQLAAEPTRFKTHTLTVEEEQIAAKVRKLMEEDKLYHEASFSRSDLAREVGASESIVSRVVNAAFGKSFPRLLNELRVEDAKRLLQNPDIAIQVAAFEVGFNSLASFNRAFREVTGETPTQYRQTLQMPVKS